MLHDRDTSGKFRYLLFYGVSVADNRASSMPSRNRCHESCIQAELETDASSSSTCYCGDAYFAMLADDYGMPK